MKHHSGWRGWSFFDYLSVTFLVVVLGMGVYFYQSLSGIYKTSNIAIAAPDKNAKSSHEFEALIKSKANLEAENAALKAQKAKFESEKNVILNQVRTSVKAFDDYRQKMTLLLKT